MDYGRVQDLPTLLTETFVLRGNYSRHRDRCHGAPVGDLSGERFVVCLQNHDQVGNRAVGERLGSLLSPPAQRLAASLLLLAPHLPLLFMGEEYGEEHPFQFFCSFGGQELVESIRAGRRQEFAAFHTEGREVPDPQAEATFEACRLTWKWASEPHKAGLRRLYQDLLTARRAWPALRDYTQRAARLRPGTHPEAILELLRGGRTPVPDKTLQAYFNLTPVPQQCPGPGALAILWSSEVDRYHGGRQVSTPLGQLLPYECVVYGPTTWQQFLKV
jgi:maltooligosyltrehalose trehalohydrolase